jgi:hypothetical protein
MFALANPCPDSFVAKNLHKIYPSTFSSLTGFYVLFHNDDDDCSYPSMSVEEFRRFYRVLPKAFHMWALVAVWTEIMNVSVDSYQVVVQKLTET